MSTINISLPESMRRYVEQKAAEGEFTASEYIRHLIRADQEEEKREKRLQLAQYLALCEMQLSSGQGITYSRERVLTKAKKLKGYR